MGQALRQVREIQVGETYDKGVITKKKKVFLNVIRVIQGEDLNVRKTFIQAQAQDGQSWKTSLRK